MINRPAVPGGRDGALSEDYSILSSLSASVGVNSPPCGESSPPWPGSR
jgi:hypothetical protein